MQAYNDFPRDRVMQVIDQSPTYGRYTPLKVSLEELFHAIKDQGLQIPQYT